jgi:leucyl-tRNA synthetase
VLAKKDSQKFLGQALGLLKDFETKVEQRLFHVAVARLMELTNLVARSEEPSEVTAVVYGHLLLGLYPFAPHLVSEWFEEVWDADISQHVLSVEYASTH